MKLLKVQKLSGPEESPSDHRKCCGECPPLAFWEDPKIQDLTISKNSEAVMVTSGVGFVCGISKMGIQ